ncbi:hypothetical protein [Terracoccus luteus]|uniref:Lipoprotein LpqN n=1 Tax=Terracoccus luteus TaxID=53356 RepID=A0A839PT51_9MICO|nr:hypothetical protein [Terracoccus luteus]MBB2985944.1 hypothetical protein [Terracoccus luteus]MCP2171596.1 hypothetical protein [Terracoccus luteus]
MTRPARLLSVTLLTALLVLAGCSTDGGDTTAPDAPPPTSTTTGAPSGGSTSGATSSSATAPTSASSTSASSPTSATSSGPVAGRSGTYTVTAPTGWGVATDQAGSVQGIDLVLLSSSKVAGFGNNLVVIVTPGDATVVAQELEKGRTQMGQAGRKVSDAPDVQVAGVTAKGFQTTYEQQGVNILARSYAMARSGKVYLLTLSSSQQDGANALAQLGRIVASWRWTAG